MTTEFVGIDLANTVEDLRDELDQFTERCPVIIEDGSPFGRKFNLGVISQKTVDGVRCVVIRHGDRIDDPMRS